MTNELARFLSPGSSLKPLGGTDDAAGGQALDIGGRVPKLGEQRRRIGSDARRGCRPSSWHVVYAKPAFGGARAVLRYLGRYTHRVAISNHRLRAFDGDHVTFQWKDYAHGGRSRTMTLATMEFLRRFVQHVLPRGFVRIRHFGYLAAAITPLRAPHTTRHVDARTPAAPARLGSRLAAP